MPSGKRSNLVALGAVTLVLAAGIALVALRPTPEPPTPHAELVARSGSIPRQLCADSVVVSSLAGSGAPGFLDGSVKESRFWKPSGVGVGRNGEVYVADSLNHRIRVIGDGQVKTFAGDGREGFADGPAGKASFWIPMDVAVGPDNEVYVADSLNHRVRVIRDGQVSTLAGTGRSGFVDGPAVEAQFNGPQGIAVGDDGSIYVADHFNQRVRVIRKGKVSTLAGCGIQGTRDGPVDVARFLRPTAIAAEGKGTPRWIVGDRHNRYLREIRGGTVRTLARDVSALTQDGGLWSQFRHASGLAIGPGGSVYVADAGKHVLRVVEDDKVRSLAGTGEPGFVDGAGSKAQFDRPADVVLGRNGELYVADSGNHRIRVVNSDGAGVQRTPIEAKVSKKADAGLGAAPPPPTSAADWSHPIVLSQRRRNELYEHHRRSGSFPASVVAELHGTAVEVTGAVMPIDPVPSDGALARFWLSEPSIVMAGCAFCNPPTLGDLVYVERRDVKFRVEPERLYDAVVIVKVIGRLFLGPARTEDGVEYLYRLELKEVLD